MKLDPDTCYRAMTARDDRFDGLFFVAVHTTGVYCRPVCPARTPRRDRCTFYGTALEAEGAGFRPCLRCRPELAPGSAPIDAVPRLAGVALARLTRDPSASVGAVAKGLGVTPRHLRRVLQTTFGLGPSEILRSRRLGLARELLRGSRLPLSEVAFASGFSSIRRFNAAFRERFGLPPSTVRRTGGDGDALELRLDHRGPLDFDSMLAFLAPRATPGVEEVSAGRYRRTVRLGPTSGWVEVRAAGPRRLVARVSASLASELLALSTRLRDLFDLDASPDAVAAALDGDPLVGPLARLRPGLRVPGAFDGFEVAARAILGQQVTVKGATTLAARLADRFGGAIETPFASLGRLFPDPATVASAGAERIATIGLPMQRARAICALSEAVAGGALALVPGADPGATIELLEALPGVGPWTAQIIVLRALRWPDAFPAGDLGIRKALGVSTAADAERRSQALRPFRSYATLHLWAGGLS